MERIEAKELFDQWLSRRILVVDDEPDINTTLEKALEQNGFKVDSFEFRL